MITGDDGQRTRPWRSRSGILLSGHLEKTPWQQLRFRDFSGFPRMKAAIFHFITFTLLAGQCPASEIIPSLPRSDKSGYSTSYNSSFRTWLSNKLKDYDSRLRPNFGSKVMRISLRFFVIGISHISEKDMSFTVEMFFHETWNDPRLQFNIQDFDGQNPLTLPSDAPQLLWMPDTTFLNALKSTSPERGSMSHMYYTKLYANGTVTQSRRISVTASCHMDLTMYPFDRQACRLELSSYGWTVNDIIYDWSKDKEGLSINRLSLQDYYVTRYVKKVTNRTYHAGVFSIPQLCIELNRRSGFYFLQLIIPATAVVGSTWTSLWLESETKFGDLVAVILAIIFLSYSYNTMMPKVSYVKSMDVYLLACFLYTFLSLCKLAIGKYLRQKVAKNQEVKKHQELAEHAQTAMIKEMTGMSAPALAIARSISNMALNQTSDHHDSDLIVVEEEIVIDHIPFTVNSASVIDSNAIDDKSGSDQFVKEEVITENFVWECSVVQSPSIQIVVHSEPMTVEPACPEPIIEMEKESIKKSPTNPAAIHRKRSMARATNSFIRRPAHLVGNDHHDKYWRLMKAFHIISQLILPLLFVAFGLFYFCIYPYFKDTGRCT